MSNTFEESRGVSRRSGVEVGDVNRMELQFKKYADDGGYTSEQIQVAYMRALRSADEIAEDKTEVSEMVANMGERMKQMIAAGFPLNRFATMIDARERIETRVPRYYQLVDGLAITDKEKEMLKSLVERERTGMVECHVGGAVRRAFSISGSDGLPEVRATMIGDYITRFLNEIGQGKKYEFWFQEQ